MPPRTDEGGRVDAATYGAAWLLLFVFATLHAVAKLAWNAYALRKHLLVPSSVAASLDVSTQTGSIGLLAADANDPTASASTAASGDSALTHAVSATVDALFVATHYLLMLVMMSYSVGFFFAIMGGSFLGLCGARVFVIRRAAVAQSDKETSLTQVVSTPCC